MHNIDQLHVLLIEDDEEDYLITKNFLDKIKDKHVKLDWAPTFSEGKKAIIAGQHDVCLIDYRLGKNTGLDLLRFANEIEYRTPTIILTGQENYETDMEATEAGASDFLVKGEFDTKQLERSIRYAIKVQQTTDTLRQATNKLKKEIEIRKETAIELVAAKEVAEAASQAKTIFLTNMSHEMRTPMHAILGYSDLGTMNASDSSTEDLTEYFKRISTSGRRLLRLITALLDLSELETGLQCLNLEKADLMQTVEAAQEKFITQLSKKSLTLEITAKTTDTIAQFDAKQIQQVIVSLINNAIEYTPEKSHLSLSISSSELTRTTKDTIITTPALTLALTDQGIGVPEDELESIFDLFLQSTKTNTSGTGLGLSLCICKKIIDRHQGKIWAKNNTPNKGATFSFTIPCKIQISEKNYTII